jgi:hypothetical protein
MHASILDEKVVVFSQCLKVRIVDGSPVRVGVFLHGKLIVFLPDPRFYLRGAS